MRDFNNLSSLQPATLYDMYLINLGKTCRLLCADSKMKMQSESQPLKYINDINVQNRAGQLSGFQCQLQFWLSTIIKTRCSSKMITRPHVMSNSKALHSGKVALQEHQQCTVESWVCS